jgi:hypothetical protein
MGSGNAGVGISGILFWVIVVYFFLGDGENNDTKVDIVDDDTPAIEQSSKIDTDALKKEAKDLFNQAKIELEKVKEELTKEETKEDPPPEPKPEEREMVAEPAKPIDDKPKPEGMKKL